MQSTWDLNQLYWNPPAFRYYLLFLMLVWGITASKIIKIWRALQQTKAQKASLGEAHAKEVRSLLFWTGQTLLGCGLFISVSLSETSARLLAYSPKHRNLDLLFLIAQGYASVLVLTLVTANVLYLFHWVFWKRTAKMAQDATNL